MIIEHDCSNYHYGNMDVIRPCCIEFAKNCKDNAIKYALTDQHTAYQSFIAIWNDLTDKEREIVGDCHYSFIQERIIAD